MNLLDQIIKQWKKLEQKEGISFEDLIQTIHVNKDSHEGGFFMLNHSLENVEQYIEDQNLKDNSNIFNCLAYRYSQCSYAGYEALMCFLYNFWSEYKFENDKVCDFRNRPASENIIHAWCFIVLQDMFKNSSWYDEENHPYRFTSDIPFFTIRNEIHFKLAKELRKYYDVSGNISQFSPTSGRVAFKAFNKPYVKVIGDVKQFVKVAHYELAKLVKGHRFLIVKSK